MDDFDDDQDGLAFIKQLRTHQERRRSVESLDYDEASDTPEGRQSQWDAWMCPACGIFMKEHHSQCLRCHLPRI